MKKEIVPLTGLRGISAIYVMLFHYSLGLPFSNPFFVFLAHGYLAVDMFFVLSGFVMALTYKAMFENGWAMRPYLKFLSRRIARVYPLYFAAAICGLGLVLFGFVEPPASMNVYPSFLLNIFMVQTWGFTESFDGPAWSISAEWFAYLMFPVLVSFCLFGRQAVAWASVMICLCLLTLLSVLPLSFRPHSAPEALLDFHESNLALPLVRCISEFSLGLLAYRSTNNEFVASLARTRGLPALICLVTIFLMAIPNTDVAIVCLFPLVIVTLAFDGSMPAKLLALAPARLAGEYSYSIYLMHGLFGAVLHWVHQFTENLGIRHAQTFAAVAAMALTIPAAFLAYRFIERPGRQMLRTVIEDNFLLLPRA